MKTVQTLQTDILLRFMKQSEFEALLEEYKKNRKRIRASAPVKKDYDIAIFQNKYCYIPKQIRNTSDYEEIRRITTNCIRFN